MTGFAATVLVRDAAGRIVLRIDLGADHFEPWTDLLPDGAASIEIHRPGLPFTPETRSPA